MTVDCSTDEHRFTELCAYGLIILIPLGVPVLYLDVILTHRHELDAIGKVQRFVAAGNHEVDEDLAAKPPPLKTLKAEAEHQQRRRHAARVLDAKRRAWQRRLHELQKMDGGGPKVPTALTMPALASPEAVAVDAAASAVEDDESEATDSEASDEAAAGAAASAALPGSPHVGGAHKGVTQAVAAHAMAAKMAANAAAKNAAAHEAERLEDAKVRVERRRLERQLDRASRVARMLAEHADVDEALRLLDDKLGPEASLGARFENAESEGVLVTGGREEAHNKFIEWHPVRPHRASRRGRCPPFTRTLVHIYTYMRHICVSVYASYMCERVRVTCQRASVPHVARGDRSAPPAAMRSLDSARVAASFGKPHRS